ncbi:MAG: hypothetical protein MK291_04135 [Planctomycetes bacterium]|nr:hypothetical protein [Planctomycetota bacterium]
MVGPRRGVGLFVAALLSASCVSVVWEREAWHRPPSAEAVESLSEGRADLAACLEALGAPMKVWQVGDGVALSWAWYESKELSYRLQVPMTQTFNASFDYATVDRETLGLLLVFDSSDRLVMKREGFLKDLMAEGEERSPAVPSSLKGEA